MVRISSFLLLQCEAFKTVHKPDIIPFFALENKPADVTVDKVSEQHTANMKTDNLISKEALTNDCKQVEADGAVKDESSVLESFTKNLEQEQITLPLPKLKPKKVAFISVKKPEASKANDTGLLNKLSDDRVNGEKEDSFFRLLTGGI